MCNIFMQLYLKSVTEKSYTYDVSFPQASISKNNSVSLNQLKGLLTLTASQKLLVCQMFF